MVPYEQGMCLSTYHAASQFLAFMVACPPCAARLRGISEEVLRAVRSHLPPEVQLLDLLMGLAGR